MAGKRRVLTEVDVGSVIRDGAWGTTEWLYVRQSIPDVMYKMNVCVKDAKVDARARDERYVKRKWLMIPRCDPPRLLACLLAACMLCSLLPNLADTRQTLARRKGTAHTHVRCM
jgi:hypothetical protein